MRLQRSFFGFLHRWVDLTQARSLQMAPVIVPTVSLGRDYVDLERGSFYWSIEDNGTPGEVAIIEVVPVLGDVEILAAWVARPGGNLDAAMELDAFTAPSVSTVTQRSSAAGLCNARIIARTEAPAWSRGTAWLAPSNETLFLPLAGTLLEVGRRLRFGTNNPGQPARVGVLVRNVGGQ